MDQRASDTRRDIEGARAVMAETIGMVEERAQETMEGVKSTVDRAMAGFKQVQATVEGAKSTVDPLIERVKLTVEETIERLKTRADLADLVDQVQQHPWLMLGNAILLGYLLGGLAKDTSSASGQRPERPRPDHASAPDGHAPSEVHHSEAGCLEALMQCASCDQLIRPAAMGQHAASCMGQGSSSRGGMP